MVPPQSTPQFDIIKLRYFGEGKKYFVIVIVNWLLTIVTLGLYYPWARVASLKYNYSQTELLNSRFTFLGNGMELFKGFIKVLGIVGALVAVYFWGTLTQNFELILLGGVIFIVGFASIAPLAVHSAMRYRMSKTSWKGIQFHYSGNLSELYKIGIKYSLLYVVTLGIAAPWFYVSIKRYLTEHIHYGNLNFEYRAKGGDLFVLFLKGYLLTFFTCGIYGFWFYAELVRFNFDNTYLKKDNATYLAFFKSNFDVGDSFRLFLYLIGTYFTLGLLYPWFAIENTRTILENLDIYGYVDLDTINNNIVNQTNDATGVDLLDAFDIGFTI